MAMLPPYCLTKKDILESLHNFNQEAKLSMNRERFKLIFRHGSGRYWVYDPSSNSFGPSKFVEFKNMHFETYDSALATTPDKAFYGGVAWKKIAKILGKSFEPNEFLAERLEDWAESICPGVTNGIKLDLKKFVSL